MPRGTAGVISLGEIASSLSIMCTGRVGEPGQNKLTPHGNNLDGAIKDFTGKFKDKTKCNWCGARAASVV